MNILGFSISPPAVLGLFVFVPVAALIFWILRKETDRVLRLTLSALSGACLWALAAWNFTDHPHIGHMFVSRDGKILAKDLEAVWQWVEPYRSAQAVKYAVNDTVDMYCAPITENPKVVPLIYSVRVTNKGEPEDALLFHRQGGMTSVKRELYNIDRFKSKEMAEKFFNPLEDSQQAEFRCFIEANLAHVLPKGIVVESATFDLYDPQKYVVPSTNSHL